MNKIKSFFKNELEDYKVLLRSIPSWLILFFVSSVVFMNLFANKELSFGVSWIAADCGILMSWIFFLCMDVIVKRFGPKASIKVSILAMVMNLFYALVCFIVSIVPGNWGASYDYDGAPINEALNGTFGGTWYILLGSSIAFLVSSIVNALINAWIGKIDTSHKFWAFALRSYVSTFIGQFVDNIIFAEIVSANFFGWTQVQCISCAFIGAVLELLFEVCFSWIGFRTVNRWERNKVGQEYLDYIKEKKA